MCDENDETKENFSTYIMELNNETYGHLLNIDDGMLSISENMFDGLVLTDEKGLVIKWNRGMESITGLMRGDVLGKPIWEVYLLLTPEEKKDIRYVNFYLGSIKKFYKSGISPSVSLPLETEILRPDGTTRIIQDMPFPIKTGKGYLAGSIIRDITASKRIEDDAKKRLETELSLLEKELPRLDRLNLLGELAAAIGHEIRNPMTTVRGFLQMLSQKQECCSYKEYFDLMIEELDRANSIISQFLSMAKNKDAELKINNINTVIKSLYPLIKADAILTDKDISLKLDDVPDIPLDEKEIRQLILNLVRNGLEAMSPGGAITIKTYSIDDFIVMAVQDQGIGIESNVLYKIGTPFLTTKEGGTGLGLAVCYKIARKHKATIDIDTGPAGTTFLVKFRI